MKNTIGERKVITPFIASGDRSGLYKASIFEGFEICEDKCTGDFLIYGIKKNNEKVLLTYESNRQDAEAALGKLMEYISRSENYCFPILRDRVGDKNIVGVIQKGEQIYDITKEGNLIKCEEFSSVNDFAKECLRKNINVYESQDGLLAVKANECETFVWRDNRINLRLKNGLDFPYVFLGKNIY